MVTRRVVLLLVTLRQALPGHGGHHPRHVDVGQTVGELVDVHVDAVDAVLRVNLTFESWFSSSLNSVIKVKNVLI